MTRGRFIVLEGGEGAGKSTQARMLADALEKRKIDFVATREPGGTHGAERIRDLLLDPTGDGWNLHAEALLFAAARSDHVKRLINPALERGTWVICDRFLDSSRAYQGGGGGLRDEDIIALHGIGSGGLLPDRTLLFEVDPAVAAARLAARDAGAVDRIGGRDEGYHARVAATFAAIAQAEAQRFTRINANHPAEMVHAEVMATLAPMLDERT